MVILAGGIGSAAFGVYGVVENPKSAIFSISGAPIRVRERLDLSVQLSQGAVCRLRKLGIGELARVETSRR